MSSALTPPRAATACIALVLANLRYWCVIAPLTRSQLKRWEARARAIPDPTAQMLACEKLADERFNIEAATTLATLAPRGLRAHVVEAIVALQVAYDYLDALTEQPLGDPIDDSQRLFAGFIAAFDQSSSRDPIDARAEPDGGYLLELIAAASGALARLPAAEAVAGIMQRTVERCAHAQMLTHAAAHTGTEKAERWARQQAPGGSLDWPEVLAGTAGSVLGLHALIAAAADGATTHEEAGLLDAAYLSIAALTMLDGLIDQEHDLSSGALVYAELYDSPEQMGRALAAVARDAADRAAVLPHAAHHTMILAGVVAYYASAPAAKEPHARLVFASVRHELEPLLTPTLGLMRTWRLAKRLRQLMLLSLTLVISTRAGRRVLEAGGE
ncbi:MAG TPA: DUF2600 family protein [Solirubrobacteraceae bacterium]|jgi:tetraprenyl-beta-curcumene synthase